MKRRILVPGAGFGGLELSTMLSEAFGDGVDVTLIDKSDSFYFGFSKLDVMFGHARPNAVRLPYKKVVKPGVRLLQETISLVDPIAKLVTTDRGTPMRRISWSSRSEPTTILPPRRAWPTPPSSIPLRARRGWVKSFLRSPRAAF
jgi:NADH dehydrogenase FAD-containing subunit